MTTGEILGLAARWLAALAGVAGFVLALLARRSARAADERAHRAEERADTIYQVQIRERAARFRAAQLYSVALDRWLMRQGSDMERARAAFRTKHYSLVEFYRRLRAEPIKIDAVHTADEEAFLLIRRERGVARIDMLDHAVLVYFDVPPGEEALPAEHRPAPDRSAPDE